MIAAACAAGLTDCEEVPVGAPNSVNQICLVPSPRAIMRACTAGTFWNKLQLADETSLGSAGKQ